jgi:hypothetical protein
MARFMMAPHARKQLLIFRMRHAMISNDDLSPPIARRQAAPAQ